jgi:hypothetical protein
VNQAIGTEVREATLLSRLEKCRVVIEVEQPNGKFKREQIISPPVSLRRNPHPARD